ncbi:MAG: hypothetical protein GY906_25835, partial [bacterium]|nr:hypothetical protein [bacterium]
MKRQAEKRAELNPEEVRLCLREECNKQVHGHKNKLFCSKKCRYKVQDERKAIAAEAQAILTGEKDALESRRGKIYVHLKNLFDQGDLNLEDWLSGVLTSTRIGELTGYSAAGISRTKRAFMIDLGVESARSEWERHPRHVAMLGPDHQYMARLAAEDPEAFEMELDIAVNAFVEFRDEFFEYLPGKKFLTKPVHRRWIKAILRTIYTGGRGMVLSPPRHGKSELLVHFCIWMILREPNIRILWIG